ncbi:MAG: hypothetical protein ACFHU9_08615 [Fluviicola sp.]
MKKAPKINIPKPCDQKWSDMTPNQIGRHCDLCDVTLLDLSTLTDTQIMDKLEETGTICIRASETQLQRPLVDFSNRNGRTFNLKAVAMGLGLLITVPSFGHDAPSIDMAFNLIELIQNHSEDENLNATKGRISFTLLNKNNGAPIPDYSVQFLDANMNVVFDVKSNKDGEIYLSSKKLERKKIRHIKVDGGNYYKTMYVPVNDYHTNYILSLEPNNREERYMIIGMVEYDH